MVYAEFWADIPPPGLIRRPGTAPDHRVELVLADEVVFGVHGGTLGRLAIPLIGPIGQAAQIVVDSTMMIEASTI